ncbi:MAG: glycosyltransferase family 2 protein [Gemmatimonas sp.]|nr:glycosyltransferase family 2 protein [Gemmatimonas sp.]
MPGISVIIPAFNNGAYIAEAVQSVLSQTVRADEIIVVDDGSVDNTESVVRSIADPRVQYHWHPNSGVSSARNFGLDVATGSYIAFLDADDRWRPSMLEQQLQLLTSEDDIVCCFANFVRFLNDTGEELPHQFTFFPELQSLRTYPSRSGAGRVIEGNAFASLVSFGDFPAFMLTMLFRADFIKGLRFDRSLVRCQDADFVLRAYLRGKAAFSNEIVADVRRHGRNATSDVSMMTLDKLKALECVRKDPNANSYMEILEHRIGRAKFEAASSLLQRRRLGEAFSLWADAMRSRSGTVRKAKSSVRLTLDLAAVLAKTNPLTWISRTGQGIGRS